MISHRLLAHGDDAAATHMSGSSVWMLISMIAFSIFLLCIAWTLVRPTKDHKPTAADIATERFARGEIGDDEFKRSVLDIDRPRG
jgi:uncharacterized membrane protein